MSISINAQSVFDSIVIKNTNSYLPNSKITYAYNYCDKNLNKSPHQVYLLLIGIEEYLYQNLNLKRWCEYHYHLANYYFVSEMFDSAYSSYNDALEQQFSLTNEQLAKIHINLSFVNLLNGKVKDAKQNLLTSAAFVKTENNAFLKGMQYQQQALINAYEENYPLASSLYQKAIAQYQEENDSTQVGSVYCDIALLYSKIGNHPLAIDYLEKAETIFNKLDNKRYLASNQLKIGDTYINATKYHKALKSLDVAERLFIIFNDQKNLAKTYSLKGKTFDKLRDYTQSLSYLNKALELMISQNNKSGETITLLLLGDLYTDMVRIPKAQHFYTKSLQLVIDPSIKLELYEKLSNNYSKIGDYYKAYKYQILYNGLQKNILTEINRIHAERLTRRISEELTNHENEKRILQTELSILMEGKKERITFFQVMILGQILVIGILIFIIIRFKKRSKHAQSMIIKTVNNQRSQLQKSNAEFNKLKKTSERVINIATKNMWEPFWVLERLSNQMADSNDDESIELEGSTHDNDQLIMARNLLENVLHWAKNQQKSIEYHPELLAVNDLLNSILKTQKLRAAAKKINITYKQQGISYVYTDKATTKVALRNIIENAIKFSTIKGKILITVQNQGNSTEITIHDDGVGMTKDQINSLFSTQSPYLASGTHGEKGVGLGLSLSKEFIERNSGKLAINSSIALGTTVSIILPSKPNS
ncbi:MAG: tetratricopeptide repeat protein [Salinivirgaceae bacterium]|nr:tetratricopeptide repeat protein [Salinivirgaceae bacterium]